MDKKRLMELAGIAEAAGQQVTVGHAITAYKQALMQLQKLNPNLPIEVIFDEGGYGAGAEPKVPRHIDFDIGVDSGIVYITVEV